MAATTSEYVQIASTSIPRTITFALGTIYDCQVSDWFGRLRIQGSMLLKSSSSAQTSGGETKWGDELVRERERIHKIYGSAKQRCRELDLHGLCGDVH